MSFGDTSMIPVALRVAAKLERYLAHGGTAAERKELARARKQLRRAEYWTARGRPLGTPCELPRRSGRRTRCRWGGQSLRGQPLEPGATPGGWPGRDRTGCAARWRG